jgi:hypothetical protein
VIVDDELQIIGEEMFVAYFKLSFLMLAWKGWEHNGINKLG